MFVIDQVILIGAGLVLLGIVSSKFSARLGLPVLVLFLAIGMLAGDQGIGGIAFENYTLAHGIGTFALAVILFDGGLRTEREAIRSVFGPALTMSTLGVLVTAVICGLAASYIVGIPPLAGLLLGSIIGSTDAAAVFLVLRSKGVNLRPRLSSTLQVESGANDPMAVLLTIGVIEVILADGQVGWDLLGLFVAQMGIGAVAGLVVGRLAVWVINRVRLDSAGLYPVLAAAAGLFSFGLAATLGGSGFLAVYVAGIVIGNRRLVFKSGILLFNDVAAWFSQIVMFVLLGLLSFPRRLIEIAPEALLLAAVLILVARPVAVFLLLSPFRFSFRELLLLSWVGLKGAVPIVLATFPLLFGLPNAELIFDVTFFVVLISAVLQGWSLPVVARRLGLEVPPEPAPPLMLEISSLQEVDGDIVEYGVTSASAASGVRIRDLGLPEGAVIAMIARQQHVIPPRGSTTIQPGDYVYIVLRPEARESVQEVFESIIDDARPDSAGHERTSR